MDLEGADVVALDVGAQATDPTAALVGPTSPRSQAAFHRWTRGRLRPSISHEQDKDDDKCRTCLKEKAFWIFFTLICLGCGISIATLWANDSPSLGRTVKLESIPLVSVLFTWAHIVLAVQMMFYPVNFLGIWNYRSSGYGLGWQGVVPRKAGIMAQKSCDLMIGGLIQMEEIVDRFHVDEFFDTLGTVLVECQRNVNEKLGATYLPKVWDRLPKAAKDEILSQVMDTQHISFVPIMAELRRNITKILNVRDMCVTRYTEDPRLLIALFQQVGRKEFQFIQRCGAQMGLLLGFAQMGLFFLTEHIQWMPWLLLPASGLFIGIFTNWLAIKMIFCPKYPHFFCCGTINIQGLFMKRQPQVAKELAKLLTDTCINAEHMIKYLVSSPGYQEALDICYRHSSEACDTLLGSFGSWVPIAMGKDEWMKFKRQAVEELLQELPNHSQPFLKYVDQALHIEDTIATRLAKLPPDEFEGMLHPAFQEDEWMLILLGGGLGVAVGLLQAALLGN